MPLGRASHPELEFCSPRCIPQAYPDDIVCMLSDIEQCWLALTVSFRDLTKQSDCLCSELEPSQSVRQYAQTGTFMKCGQPQKRHVAAAPARAMITKRASRCMAHECSPTPHGMRLFMLGLQLKFVVKGVAEAALQGTSKFMPVSC